jgi:23S rRNA G2069 N7-methylase RlmK/C1962 C5-methylase RlmI
MLRPGGLLVTCSCSHHVGWAELEASVASAAADAPRRVRLLERRGASTRPSRGAEPAGDRVPEVPGAAS